MSAKVVIASLAGAMGISYVFYDLSRNRKIFGDPESFGVSLTRLGRLVELAKTYKNLESCQSNLLGLLNQSVSFRNFLSHNTIGETFEELASCSIPPLWIEAKLKVQLYE